MRSGWWARVSRRTPERRAWLAAERAADPATALNRLLGVDPGIVDIAAFRLRRNLTPDEAAGIEKDAPMVAAEIGRAHV